MGDQPGPSVHGPANNGDHGGGGTNAPPIPSSLADKVKIATGKMKPKTESKDLGDIKGKDDKSRTFLLLREPPFSYKTWLTAKFKSLNVCTLEKFRIKGYTKKVLSLGFKGTHEDCDKDFKEAATITFKIKDEKKEHTIVLKALDAAETDSVGTYLPKIVKRVILSNLNLAMCHRLDIIKERLSKYMEFKEDVKLIPSTENGVFTGKASISVEDFKEVIPAKHMFLPAIRKSEEGTYIEIPDSEVEVRIDCIGYGLRSGVKVEEENCRFCKKPGHFARDCEELKKKKERQAKRNDPKNFKCFHCGLVGGGCTISECKEGSNINNGIFPSLRQAAQTKETSEPETSTGLPPNVSSRKNRRGAKSSKKSTGKPSKDSVNIDPITGNKASSSGLEAIKETIDDMTEFTNSLKDDVHNSTAMSTSIDIANPHDVQPTTLSNQFDVFMSGIQTNKENRNSITAELLNSGIDAEDIENMLSDNDDEGKLSSDDF